MNQAALKLLVLLLTMPPMSACDSLPNNPAGLGDRQDPSTSRTRDSAIAPDGVEIYYEIAGEGDPALVFVHGWSCDRSYWREQFDHFSTQYRVVSIDLGGHGESGRERNDWTMAAFGADVHAVVEKAGLANVVLVGHSMGGPVIVEAAKLMPERTAAVIPVDHFHDVNNPMTDEELDAFIAPMLEDFSNVYGLVVSFFGPHAGTSLADSVARGMASALPEVAIPALRSTFQYNDAAGLAAIDAPIRLINADLWPTDLAALRESNDAIQLAVVPAAGHFLMMDAPEEFNRLLERAVQETTSAR